MRAAAVPTPALRTPRPGCPGLVGGQLGRAARR